MPLKRNGLTRRGLLGALAASVAAPAWALAPERSPFPAPRLIAAPARALPSAQSIEALLERANLGGVTSFVALDAASGAVIEELNPDASLPPASITKAATALYVLSVLGPEARFETRVLANGGTVSGGVLAGDLVLQGGGDPTLQTADLARLANALVAAGLRRVSGRFLIDETALPWLEQIAPDMPPQAGYNPAISGLNLNFNRVHFLWRPEGGQMQLSLDARSGGEVPPVSVIGITAGNRTTPVYTYDGRGGREMWSVAAGALGGGGSRWLPVRRPGIYAGDVLRALLAARGCTLPPPQAAQRPARGQVLAAHQSAPLREMMREMLRFSTNITAESAGLAASRRGNAAIDRLEASAQHMSAWIEHQHGVSGLRFVDHSGLGDRARVSARAMASLMLSAHREGMLPPLLRRHMMRDQQYRELPNHPIAVRAKTGTLNFVNALAGYARPAGSEREIIFTIISANLPRREAINPDERERPPGAPAWARSARMLQQGLIERWSALHG